MLGTSCLRGLAILGVTVGVTLAPGATTSDLLGISSAKAEKFYTRKRVNGQWITGMFPADETAPTRRSIRPKRMARAKPAVMAALGAATIEVATKTGLPTFQGVEAGSMRDTGLPSHSVPVRTEWASVPSQAALTTATSSPPETRQMSDVGSMSAPPAVDERLARLRSALLARAQDLAAKGADAPVENTAKLEPRSVSYDFESGVKTTVFANSVVREAFDVASIKRIALPSH